MVSRNNFHSHRFSLNRINFSIIIPPIILVIIGLAAFYSIDLRIFNLQFFFLIVSLISYFVFLNIDYKIFVLYSNQLYFIIVGLLLILFFIGVEARGAVRWIDIFGIRLQFSEIIKPFFVVIMARYLTKDSSRSFLKFAKSLLFLFPVFFLTLKQPDLGNALIFFFVTVGMLLVYGFPFKYFLILISSILIPAPFIFSLLHDYQKERILTFINVGSDPFGSSYNAIQSFISIGSGGFFGKGFGQATQSILKFLPERHTDFIFATISESIGFVGSSFLILIFLYFFITIYKESQKIRDEMSYVIVMGYFFLFLSHTFFNIGMNIGLVPIVGITLPFVSYGGSSLLTNFIVLGILCSVIFEFNKRQTLEIR